MSRAEAIEKIVTRILQERSGTVERMTLPEWKQWIERLLEMANEK